MRLRVRGVVRGGKGEARSFTELDWVRAAFRGKYGFELYPGTLNLQVEGAATLLREAAAAAWRLEPEAPGFCAAWCLPVRLGRLEAVWVSPEVPGYPEDLVELVADRSLRAALGLHTGDAVWIQIRGQD